MSRPKLSVAFIPLVDAAPVIAAREMGFAQEEGFDLDLVRAPSWSSVRDMLAFGRVEAAHLLSPVPVAMALGLGGVSAAFSAVQVLSVNGNVVGVSHELGQRLAAEGHDFGFHDAAAAGQALVAAADGRLRVGVPFPFSMHAELLFFWLSASGLPAPQGIEIRTVPPPLMAEAMGAGEIDAFCVGEPWGSIAVETGTGRLLLPGHAIWSYAPEKVLAVRTDWARDEPSLTGRLMRAVWKASRWLGSDGTSTTAAELLSRPDYLDLSPEIIDRALSGHLVISGDGESREVPDFLEFWKGAATFPWKSQPAWIADQMAGRLGLDRTDAQNAAARAFRTDLYRQHMREAGAILPAASQKREGGLDHETAATSESGHLMLRRNQFFNGAIFDPTTLA